MVVTRVGPMSVARIMGILYAIVGFVVGCAFSIISVAGVVPQDANNIGPMAFGAAAVFMLPLVYGFLGFISALIGAAIYNALARMIGGIEIDTREGSQG